MKFPSSLMEAFGVLKSPTRWSLQLLEIDSGYGIMHHVFSLWEFIESILRSQSQDSLPVAVPVYITDGTVVFVVSSVCSFRNGIFIHPNETHHHIT